MSYQAVQWALDEAPMLRTPAGKPDTTARAVLVARAERADENGQDSHAAITDVVWRTGYDERTVQRAQERLEAAGLMVRDGWTTWGTPRWNLDLTQRRDESERAEIDAAIERRKEIDRERSRRRRQTAAEQPRPDSASRRPDSASEPSDSESGRLDAAPPEPPMNHPGTTLEPPSGGTLPPDPLRPQSPAAPGSEIESATSNGGDQPPLAPTVTYDRAREEPTRLRLVHPAPKGRGFGFCLACHAEGKTTLAVDPVNGDACATHLRQEAS